MRLRFSERMRVAFYLLHTLQLHVTLKSTTGLALLEQVGRESGVSINRDDLLEVIRWMSGTYPYVGKTDNSETSLRAQEMLRTGGFLDEDGKWHSLFPGEE